jgi:uncharacterized repeat protein (TIGR03803 family)
MKNFNSWTKACCLFLLSTAITLPAQTFNRLHSFDGIDGSNSQAALVQATDGNLYGSAPYGGANSDGTIFKISTSGAFTLLHSFDGTDGANPWNVPVQAPDGNFYGTTYYGGEGPLCEGGCGSVYKSTSAGTVNTLHSFNGTDGTSPQAGLVLGSGGDLYGATLYSGPSGYGTVFSIDTSGDFSTLHSFTDRVDGGGPYPAMIQATDGNFYGVTYTGGAHREGTVFQMTPTGTVTTIYAFCRDQNVCVDGAEPVGGLVEGNDGNLYGTTAHGANQICGCGTIFRITLSGTLTTLHTFSGADGKEPGTRLLLASDGNFYGVTGFGGSNNCRLGCGTIFSITSTGTFTQLYDFCTTGGCASGSNPTAGLIQDTNGTFYGTTAEGGAHQDGVVYSFSMGLGPFVETQTSSGAVGTSVVILGTNLTGSTGVTFNGTPATFTVVSSSEITATVPAGATTGTVVVTLPSGTLSTNVNFQVTP